MVGLVWCCFFFVLLPVVGAFVAAEGAMGEEAAIRDFAEEIKLSIRGTPSISGELSSDNAFMKFSRLS